jgi:outer membrane protein
MKRHFVAVLLIIGIIVANNLQAQNKIGYVSLQELISVMPEYKKAAADLQEFQKALVLQGNDYQMEFFRKDSLYKTDSVKWTSAMKEVKRKELNELYLKWTNFVNEEGQQLLNKHEQELLAPIQQKAVQTSQAVAKENGYAYILPKEQLISFPAADDILPLVLKKLNITLPAAAGASAPKTGN